MTEKRGRVLAWKRWDTPPPVRTVRIENGNLEEVDPPQQSLSLDPCMCDLCRNRRSGIENTGMVVSH